MHPLLHCFSDLLIWPSNLTYTPELPDLHHPTSSLYPIPILAMLFQYSLLLPVEEVALDLQIQQFENPPSQNTSGCKKLYGLNTVQCVRHHKGGLNFFSALACSFPALTGRQEAMSRGMCKYSPPRLHFDFCICTNNNTNTNMLALNTPQY